ncbi:ABC transporter permease [Xylanimonas ulmi]|uniref:ABC-2 type transport system permease protein n=1 Tax=Xylanimonas ulmi TaxID=228973 RepID=A0A4Q7LZ49_9MICO|nr:ABC transporter permease [Xylanibacterium ulmi]RZS60031.1 hypothetical protein EV386_0272 [Xylanibacterium ulmi]
MSTTITTDVGAPRTVPYRQTMATVIRFEWIKARSLSSTWFLAGAVIALMIAFAIIAAAVQGADTPDDAVTTIMSGASITVLVIGILGCLTGAREYGSRMIAATMSAVPRRWKALAAKAIVLTGLSVVTAAIAVAGAFFIGAAVLSGNGDPAPALGDPGVLGDLLGMVLYLTVVALIGLGVGLLLRNVAGSIGTVAAGLLLVPGLMAGLLPDSWGPAVLKFMPSEAAAGITTVYGTGSESLGAGAAIIVELAWVIVLVGGAVVAVNRRDV